MIIDRQSSKKASLFSVSLMPIYGYVQMVHFTPNWKKMILMDQILEKVAKDV
jgi:hypothetical protein